MLWISQWVVLTFLPLLLLLADLAAIHGAEAGEGGGSCSVDDATCASPSHGDDWGVEQDLQDNPGALANYRAAERYMKEVVLVDAAYQNVWGKCKFDHAHCSQWAALGECDNNPSYMRYKCAPSCQSCDQLDWTLRCPFDPKQLVWNETGKVDALMKRIVRDYNAVVWSEEPWVLTIDDFLSEQECQTLIDWGHKREFERSVDAGKILPDGTMDTIVSDFRTSTNAWCLEGCYEDQVTQAVLDRLEAMLGISRIHYEYFQLLKYQVGEYYKRHHDYNPKELYRPQGNRILTVYIYLNDVPAGGGTRFNSIRRAGGGGLDITPKTGRVLIWPSVLDSDPTKMDGRTDHEALPVEGGLKFGANIWVHQRDFSDAFAKTCV